MKSKSFFSIFVAMAIVPLVLAFAVLKFGWFTPGATAKGEFVESEIILDVTSQDDKPIWHLVFQPENGVCDVKCHEQLYGLNQTYVALGKLQKRVKAIVLDQQTDLDDYPLLKANELKNAKLSADYLYIVDPFGTVIMQYEGSELRQDTIATSKDILADVKKLLNYARVG